VCPAYGELDPYAMAWAAVDEAFRNLVAVGADPDQVALLDNFCWGNANLPDRLGALVRCAQGCHDAALAYNAPYISGKDSLNNEYLGADGQRHAIPGTLVISALGIVPDVNLTATLDLKTPGDALFLVGETRPELGGSHYNLLHSIAGGTVPQPNDGAPETLRGLHRAVSGGLVRACHDLSEGGLAVALAEMCLAGRLGAEIKDAQSVETLFSESLTRFIAEVRPEDRTAFELTLQMAGAPFAFLGTVSADGRLRIPCGAQTIDLPVSDLERAWRGPQPDAAPVSLLSVPAQPLSDRIPAARTQPPRVLILHATGTNRDHDAALACALAGGAPEIVHVNQLLSGERRLSDYHMLVVPGGFSYGDDLGAGTLWALDLRHRLGDAVRRFITDGRPVLGICNGFQALVKANLLPGAALTPSSPSHSVGEEPEARVVTLARNARAHFECRWVYLLPNPASPSLFMRGLTEPIYCPVAHGEGRVAFADATARDVLWQNGLAALTYAEADYPANPNGSDLDIAGLCNPAGNVLGLMPHPENHVFAWQHPRHHRGERGLTGLRLFENGIRHA
jgi:phosphoribosylformylglycinamidine synthase